MDSPDSFRISRSAPGVTVVGLGATGSALAACLSSQGHRVTLYGRNRDRLQALQAQGGLRITGDLGDSVVPLATVTSDLEIAMRESMVLVSIRQDGQAVLAEAMASLLRNDHIILLLSGGAGSLEAARIWCARGVRASCCLGETSAPAHSARVREDGTVVIRNSPRLRTLRVAAFPADHTSRLMASIQGLFSLRPAAHVLEVALCNANIVLHPLPMLLNLGAIEHRQGRFALMAEGMTPRVLRAIDAHDAERMRLLEAVGADPVRVDGLFEELGLDPRDYREARRAPKFFDRIEARFLAEDVPCGTALMASLGRLLDVPTPISDAILGLAACLQGEGWAATARTCEALGIAGLDREQLAGSLAHGPSVGMEAAAIGSG